MNTPATRYEIHRNWKYLLDEKRTVKRNGKIIKKFKITDKNTVLLYTTGRGEPEGEPDEVSLSSNNPVLFTIEPESRGGKRRTKNRGKRRGGTRKMKNYSSRI